MGVERALNKVMEAVREGGPIYTYGPLIHNPQEIERLEKMNVIAVEDTENIKGAKVILRTHGISPAQREKLIEAGAVLQDATCPRVARVQGIIKGYTAKGWHTIIVGDRGHAEVTALMGFTKGRGFIVSSEEEIDGLPPLDRACVVSQTTMNRQRYFELAEILKNRIPKCEVFDTICDSTSDRQNEVRELCKFVDAVVVIGGKNSANTGRLCTIARELGVPAFHVETDAELNLEELSKYEKIGVSAGASTPTWVIDRVVDRLKEIGEIVEDSGISARSAGSAY